MINFNIYVYIYILCSEFNNVLMLLNVVLHVMLERLLALQIHQSRGVRTDVERQLTLSKLLLNRVLIEIHRENLLNVTEIFLYMIVLVRISRKTQEL